MTLFALFFLIREAFCFTCPENWTYESSTGTCKQTNIAVVCTGNSLVVVANVKDIYLDLPSNQESDARIQIGSCTGSSAPMMTRFVESFDISECDPTVAAIDDGLLLTWEITGASISGFDDVFKYTASCEIWRDGSETVDEGFEGVTVAPSLIGEQETQNLQISNVATLELFEDSSRTSAISTSLVGQKIYARISAPSLASNAEFFLENLISYEDSSRTGNSYEVVKDFCKTTILDFSPMDGSSMVSTNRVLDFEFNAFSFSTTGTFYLDGSIDVCTFTAGVADVNSCPPTPSCTSGYTL